MGEELAFTWTEALSEPDVARLAEEIRNDPAWKLLDQYVGMDNFRFRAGAFQPDGWPDFSVKLSEYQLYILIIDVTQQEREYFLAAFALLLRREGIDFEFEDP